MRLLRMCPRVGLILAILAPLHARTFTADDPALSFVVPDDCVTTEEGPTQWSFNAPDGNAVITFAIRPLASRGGPYTDLEEATAAITTHLHRDLGARILADTTRLSGERRDRLIELSWRQEGTALQNIEIFFAADGRLFNFTLLSSQRRIDDYRSLFFEIVDSFQLGTTPPYTIYTDNSLGLRFPVPRDWVRREKEKRVFFFEPSRGDDSSLLIESITPPAGKEAPAVELTFRLHTGLARSSTYEDLKIHGKSHVNGLDLYILSARNRGEKTPGKEIFIQIGRGDHVAALNLTLSEGNEDKWDDYISALIRGIEPVSAIEGIEVDEASLAGTVRDTAGRTARGVKVTLTLVTDFTPLSGAIVAETTTDADGRYRFAVDPAHAYLVHAGVDPDAFNAGTGAAGRRFVDLAREDTVPTLDIVLARPR